MFTALSVSRRALSASATLLLAGGATLCSMPQANAQVSLVGVLLTSNTSTGADATNGVFRFSTNQNTDFTSLVVGANGQFYASGIDLPLHTGDNVFTFTNDGGNPGTFGGIELFLNSTGGGSYNPNGGGRPADLDVARDTAAANPFFVPVAGKKIADYSANSGVLSYGGASSFLVGGQTVSVTAFSIDTSAQGGFTLRVAPSGASAVTPEPGSVALLFGMSVMATGFAVRRKLRKQTS